MDQPPNAPQAPPVHASNESKFPAILRAIGLGALVLILWFIDKVAVSRFPGGSAWRYIIGAIVIAVGLATVVFITDRIAVKDS